MMRVRRPAPMLFPYVFFIGKGVSVGAEFRSVKSEFIGALVFVAFLPTECVMRKGCRSNHVITAVFCFFVNPEVIAMSRYWHRYDKS